MLYLATGFAKQCDLEFWMRAALTFSLHFEKCHSILTVKEKEEIEILMPKLYWSFI